MQRPERRKERRLPHDDRLFVKVVSPEADPGLAGKTIHCSTVDISSNGLRLRVDTLLAEGSGLELWVGRNDGPGSLVLAGWVQWCQDAEDGHGYTVGVELDDTRSEDLATWKEFFLRAPEQTGT